LLTRPPFLRGPLLFASTIQHINKALNLFKKSIKHLQIFLLFKLVNIFTLRNIYAIVFLSANKKSTGLFRTLLRLAHAKTQRRNQLAAVATMCLTMWVCLQVKLLHYATKKIAGVTGFRLLATFAI